MVDFALAVVWAKIQRPPLPDDFIVLQVAILVALLRKHVRDLYDRNQGERQKKEENEEVDDIVDVEEHGFFWKDADQSIQSLHNLDNPEHRPAN